MCLRELLKSSTHKNFHAKLAADAVAAPDVDTKMTKEGAEDAGDAVDAGASKEPTADTEMTAA